jgi:DNA polymerase-4
MKIITYIDVDAYAVAVERLCHDELRARPIIISTQTADRGVVACASYEARAAGVWTGMPVSLARRRVEKAVFLPPNPIECERTSRRLFSFLQDQAPVVEADIIDGFFLDMTGCERWMRMPPLAWMQRLARRIHQEVGLPVSFGIATNKLVARIAAQVAKPGGAIYVMHGCEADFLEPVSVGLLPGVGQATRRELREFGVHQVWQLRDLGHEALLRLYGTAAGEALWQRAHGICLDPVTATPMAETLEFEHAFPEDTSRPDDLSQGAALLAQRLAWQLRGRQVRCCTARINLTYSDGHHAQRVVRVDDPAAEDSNLVEAMRRAALLAFRRRVRVRSIHLAAILHQEPELQIDFFQEQKQLRTGRLYSAIDQVRARHGFAALVMAGGAGKGTRVKAARQGTLEELW